MLNSIYIETTCFIDMAKHAIGTHPPTRENDIWHLKKLLEAARDGEVNVLTSSLTIAECQHADGITDKNIQKLFKGLLTSGQYVQLVQDTILIAERARDLRWAHNISLGGADAIHVASALEMKCSEILTFDDKIHHFKSELQALGLTVLHPKDTTMLPSKYRQQLLIQEPPDEGG